MCRDVLWHGSERAGSGAAIRIRPGRTFHEGEAEHDAFLHICRSATGSGKGSSFWYEYKTGNGKVWYVVDPVAKTKRPLFDLDDIAAQITEIVKDPFTAQQLPIQKLEAGEDGRTFTFQITSSQEAKKDSTDKDKGPKKEIFFFSYDYPTRKLTWLKEKKKETEYPDWASFSPDGKTVVYAKDLNLYRMSREDYEKLKKDDKDSTVTDIQLTTFGVKDFGFGQPYSLLNTDTLCNGKRKGVWGIVWSPIPVILPMTLKTSVPCERLDG